MNVWKEFQPNDQRRWDVRRVVHLHRRAAFGASWTQVQKNLNDGPRSAVDRLLNPTGDDDFESMADTIGDAAMASANPNRLKAWWFYRMLMSHDPLGERLTLMWHNHFATSNRKVKNLVQMRQQNERLRQYARAPFGDLLEAVLKHPAMLVWLDADSNRKGDPNENLARELMELFTLGIGHYSERDVKEAARSLTGWTIVGGEFVFRQQRHDDDKKSLFGKTGKFSGDDLVAQLIEHPATARRLAWRICRSFMGEGVVDEPALESLADRLRSDRLNVGRCVETVLRSELFFSDANIRSRVSGPVEYMVGTLKALELCDPPPSTLLLAEWAARMGQDLFYPPNVGGWNEGRSWLNSRTIVAHANFAGTVVEGKLWRPTHDIDMEGLLRRNSQQPDVTTATRWLATLLWGETSDEVVRRIASKTNDLNETVAMLLTRPESMLG